MRSESLSVQQKAELRVQKLQHHSDCVCGHAFNSPSTFTYATHYRVRLLLVLVIPDLVLALLLVFFKRLVLPLRTDPFAALTSVPAWLGATEASIADA